MFNTYIYGTPLGFDFFEDVASLKEYFKGLYISSRRGRRLMVNRRDNGETFYNYLRYGLAEKEGRPNSFFGMSISMDNNEYAYDFKEIFDWFDYLFDKLVERGSLFFVNAGNTIQYKVAKFKDNAEEIQWLKNNIPNLFTKAQGVKLLEYDSSFSVASSGQIRCFNDETSATKVLDAFKKCRWIALSPNFKLEEEPIEIDPSDIEAQLNKYTQQMVPIAISPKQENLSVLHSIESNCRDTIGLIQKYLKTEHDESEQRVCTSLVEKAREIVSNAKTIATKIDISGSTIPPFTPKPHLKKCNRCGQNLPLTNFSDANSQFCTDCENHIHESKAKTKKCSQCGKLKNLSEFSEGSTICYECKSRKSILDYIDSKLIAVFCVFVLIAGISLYLIFGGRKSDDPTDREQSSTEQVNQDESTSNKNIVDVSRFTNYLGNNDFIGAYGELDGRDNANDYISQLKSSVESYLWDVIDNPSNHNSKEAVQQFFISNRRIVEIIGIDENIWNQYADAYDRLMVLIKKSSLSQNQRVEAIQLIEGLPNYPATIKETFKNRIDNIPDDVVLNRKATTEPSASTEDEPKSTNVDSYYIELIDSKGTKMVTATAGYDYIDGDQIIVKSNKKLSLSGTGSGNVKPNKDRTQMRIDVKAGKTVVLSVGNIKLTISGKQKKFKKA